MTPSTFNRRLKLYYFPDRAMVSLSVRSSEIHVLTFYIPHKTFESMVKDCATHEGADIGPYFLLLKKNYLRFTHRGAEFDTNLRIPRRDWDLLIADYQEKLKSQPKDLVTCVSDEI